MIQDLENKVNALKKELDGLHGRKGAKGDVGKK